MGGKIFDNQRFTITEKLILQEGVFGVLNEHPGCRSTELISHTSFSQTTMDRCLFELKKEGLIEYTGSKKSGGYYPIG